MASFAGALGDGDHDIDGLIDAVIHSISYRPHLSVVRENTNTTFLTGLCVNVNGIHFYTVQMKWRHSRMPFFGIHKTAI